MTENPSTPVVEHPRKDHLQDPSPLVTQMVQREIAQLQELLETKTTAVRTEIITTIDAMDKALTKVEQYPTAVDMAIARVREYFDEKFRSVDMRLSERDQRFDQRDQANRNLLQEQRVSSADAIRKAEAATKQQLDTLTVALRDMKERMDRSEGKTEGAIRLWGTIVAAFIILGVLVSILALFLTRVPVS